MTGFELELAVDQLPSNASVCELTSTGDFAAVRPSAEFAAAASSVVVWSLLDLCSPRSVNSE